VETHPTYREILIGINTKPWTKMISIFEKLGEPGRWCFLLLLRCISAPVVDMEKTGSMYYFKSKFLKKT
jgi:hypothetical protein